MHDCKVVVQNNLAATGVFLSDGATNVMPVGPHKEKRSAHRCPESRKRRGHLRCLETKRSTLSNLCLRDLPSWDLPPLSYPFVISPPMRFSSRALKQPPSACETLSSKPREATLVGDVFDDAATGQGLLNYFLRGLCAAVGEEDIPRTG